MKMNGNLTVLWCNEQNINRYWTVYERILSIDFTFSRLAFVTNMRYSFFRSGWYFSRWPIIKYVEPSDLLTKVPHVLQTALGRTSWLFSSWSKYCQRRWFLSEDFLFPGVPLGSFFWIGFFLEVDVSIGSESGEILISQLYPIASKNRLNLCQRWNNQIQRVTNGLKSVEIMQKRDKTNYQQLSPWTST